MIKRISKLALTAITFAILVPGVAVAAPAGSGAPFTVVVEGQVSADQCPAGYQAANGLIVDSATGQQFTECWPANAWEAYRIGGDTWEKFRSSGGTFDPAADKLAWDAYYAAIETAKQAAYEESLAWNQANPGKQKCVSWGPITAPDGVGQSSGGVCANPVEAGGGTTVPSSEAPSVDQSEVDSSTSSSPVAPTAPTPEIPSEGAIRGNGYPFTAIVAGQVGTAGCPAGFQYAVGVIAAIGIGTFTECWPERAFIANRLGGDAWELFKATGGSYDPSVEIDRQNKVALLKAKAREVAEAAALATPGIERCSSWSGYGESGRECSYAFLSPGSSSPSISTSQSVSPSVSSSASVSNSESATTSIDVSLAETRVEGSSVLVASAALAVTPDAQEAASISALASKVTGVKTLQRGATQTLPRDPTLTYTVQSLTPKTCLVSSFRIRVSKPGLCQFEIEITDSAGNEYQILKKVRRLK